MEARSNQSLHITITNKSTRLTTTTGSTLKDTNITQFIEAQTKETVHIYPFLLSYPNHYITKLSKANIIIEN